MTLRRHLKLLKKWVDQGTTALFGFNVQPYLDLPRAGRLLNVLISTSLRVYKGRWRKMCVNGLCPERHRETVEPYSRQELPGERNIGSNMAGTAGLGLWNTSPDAR
jgi:hypothetical protein